MKRSEEIIFAVKALSPNKSDIIVIQINKINATKKLQHQLSDLLNKIGCKGITLSPNSNLDDVRIVSDEELAKIGLMKIPEKNPIDKIPQPSSNIGVLEDMKRR